MFGVIILNVIMPNVVMLNVTALDFFLLVPSCPTKRNVIHLLGYRAEMLENVRSLSFALKQGPKP